MPTVEDVKKWLSLYSENERQLDNLIERIETLRSRLEAPGSAAIRESPHGSGHERDQIGRILGQIEQLEETAQALLKKSRSLYAEIDAAVDKITVRGWPDLRAVLKMHYLDRASWHEITYMLWGGKTDFVDREESYLRRTFRIHEEALKILSNIVTDSELEEMKWKMKE